MEEVTQEQREYKQIYHMIQNEGVKERVIMLLIFLKMKTVMRLGYTRF